MVTAVMPTGLGAKSKRMWKGYIDEYALNPGEQRVLEDACREIDLIERMEVEIKKLGAKLTTKGSMGQVVEHPLVKEIRQHRATLSQLLARIKLPDEDEGAADGSGPARALANQRWRRGA